MKLCCNMSFTLPKQSQRSRPVTIDGSRFLGLFRKEKPLPNNRISMVYCNVFLSVLDRKKTFVFACWIHTRKNSLPKLLLLTEKNRHYLDLYRKGFTVCESKQEVT